MVDDLNERLRIIEERLTAVESKLSAQPAKQATPYQFKPRPPSIPSPFMLWLKENWLVSIGILLITLAVVWFTGYAFANDWIGETARIALGFIAGVVIFSVGFLLLKSKPQGGQALMILGEAITIIAIFAGHQVYPILTTFQSFLLMLVVVNLTAILAIKNNVEFLGLSSIVFAAIIPSLLISDSSNSIFLMLYVLALNGAAIGMWFLRGWGKTVYIAWLATFAYSWSLVQIQEKWIVYFFVWAFSGLCTNH